MGPELRPTRIRSRRRSLGGSLLVASIAAIAALSVLGRLASSDALLVEPVVVAPTPPAEPPAEAVVTAPAAVTPTGGTLTGFGWSRRLAVASDTEAWAVQVGIGLWHWLDGSWSPVRIAAWPAGIAVASLARSADGTIAVGTERGAAVLVDGAWRVLATVPSPAVAFGQDGTVWVAQWRGAGTESLTVTGFRPGASGWVAADLPPVTPAATLISLAVDARGGLLLAAAGWAGSLDRFDGEAWERIAEGPLAATESVADLTVGPDGAVWAVAVLGRYPDWYSALVRVDATGAVTAVRTPPRDDPPNPDRPAGLAIDIRSDVLALDDDGDVLLVAQDGYAGWDGTAWVVDPPDDTDPDVSAAVATAPDGAVWLWADDRIRRLDPLP